MTFPDPGFPHPHRHTYHGALDSEPVDGAFTARMVHNVRTGARTLQYNNANQVMHDQIEAVFLSSRNGVMPVTFPGLGAHPNEGKCKPVPGTWRVTKVGPDKFRIEVDVEDARPVAL